MIKIANIKLSSPLILAPLAGYTDLPFRLLCKEHGAGLVVSEMISCHGLAYNQPRTIDMLKSCDQEKPVSFQLFGAEPDIMGEASAIVSTYKPDIIDINMGCPVKKVVKKGAGSALMKDINLAKKIILAVVDNTNIPVTVKIRAGWDNKYINAVEFAKMIEDCGVAAITVHGRTKSQAFSGFADRNIIKNVKKSVNIPVIGNGDIASYNDGVEMMNETGCDAVMIGRAALGNPWVFTKKGRPKNIVKIAQTALRHIDLMEQYLESDHMIGYMKNHLGRYFKGLPGSAAIRKKIYSLNNIADVRNYLLGESKND